MKKSLVLYWGFAFLMGACQNIFTPTAPAGPTVDSAGTSDALFQTAIAQTLTAQPGQPTPTFVADLNTPTLVVDASPTLVVAIDTATLPPASPSLPPADALAATATSATLPAVTTVPGTSTFVIETATPFLTNPTSATTLTSGQMTLTALPTLTVRLYGTLPPAVPSSEITLVNRARTEAYISLQVTMPDGNYSILEYPVEGTVRVQAPVGHYLYVSWVGGRKTVGEFRLRQNDDLTIMLFRDRVEIK
jgi:hypothetical protein